MIARLTELNLGKSSPAFKKHEQELFCEIRSRTTLNDVKDDPVFRSYRDLYWTFGMDPTKLRVSSEALLRRIVRGLNFWRISTLVDVVNLASAYHKLPIGLIDETALVGALVVRTAHKGEVFERIGGKQLTCRGREIVLADDEKIICFGYATHDSERTKVTPTSKSILLLIYGAPVVTPDMMTSAVNLTLEMVNRWVACTVKGWTTFRSN
jgi:DNA/RNA-binding domain of Phe-tRNA-synthetase-like protein